MLPGKKYTHDDFFWMAWRRKWLILLPTAFIAFATFTASQLLPNRYRAQTTVLVIPQRVPASYVQSTVTADIGERLQTISQQILSRTRLERIVEEFNLYERERKTEIMEDVIERMRIRDVKLSIANPRRSQQEAMSFTVSFEASEPRTAMLVTERLASMFVQENLQDREQLAGSTSEFLQTQLDDARRRLVEHEKKLEEFRRRNSGQLPSQVQSNLQMMQTTQLQMQANAEAGSRERDRLVVLESAMDETAAELRERPAPASAAGGEAPSTIAQQLEAARVALRNLELRLKPDHPDVGRAKRIIAELEAKAEREALSTALTPEAQPLPANGQESPAVTRLTAMRLEAQEIRARLETRRQEDARLQRVMAGFTSRVEATPSLESELTELMRDYSTVQEQYTTLLRKNEESKIAVNLERRQIGEQFKVIDGARLPERAISPNRARINFLGLLGGLAFSLALVALLEYRDTTLKTDDDVIVSLALPVLAVIPAMVSDAERRKIKRKQRLLAVSASLAAMLMVVTVVVALKTQLFQGWVR